MSRIHDSKMSMLQDKEFWLEWGRKKKPSYPTSYEKDKHFMDFLKEYRNKRENEVEQKPTIVAQSYKMIQPTKQVSQTKAKISLNEGLFGQKKLAQKATDQQSETTKERMERLAMLTNSGVAPKQVEEKEESDNPTEQDKKIRQLLNRTDELIQKSRPDMDLTEHDLQLVQEEKGLVDVVSNMIEQAESEINLKSKEIVDQCKVDLAKSQKMKEDVQKLEQSVKQQQLLEKTSTSNSAFSQIKDEPVKIVEEVKVEPQTIPDTIVAQVLEPLKIQEFVRLTKNLLSVPSKTKPMASAKDYYQEMQSQSPKLSNSMKPVEIPKPQVPQPIAPVQIAQVQPKPQIVQPSVQSAPVQLKQPEMKPYQPNQQWQNYAQKLMPDLQKSMVQKPTVQQNQYPQNYNPQAQMMQSSQMRMPQQAPYGYGYPNQQPYGQPTYQSYGGYGRK